MKQDESIQIITNLKENGNKLLKQEQFVAAKEKYEAALKLIDFNSPNGSEFFHHP